MKCAVRYYTKTGNTKKLAEAVAAALGVEALPISVPVEEAVDILFLWNSYYACRGEFKGVHRGKPDADDCAAAAAFAKSLTE